MLAMSTTASIRSDAKRNRERLVASARELFAQNGIEVSVEEITQHAGVGMGTLYRHFPTKDELIDAVLEDAFAEIIEIAHEAAATEDAWAGLNHFFERMLALHAANRGVKDIVAARAHGARRAEAMRARIRPLLTRVIERAHEQRTLRRDFTIDDMPLVVWTAGRIIELTETAAPGLWRRYLGFLLDGLRPDTATPLSTPALTRPQLARVLKRQHR
jgi:AcrR family transcriptional regulator